MKQSRSIYRKGIGIATAGLALTMLAGPALAAASPAQAPAPSPVTTAAASAAPTAKSTTSSTRGSSLTVINNTASNYKFKCDDYSHEIGPGGEQYCARTGESGQAHWDLDFYKNQSMDSSEPARFYSHQSTSENWMTLPVPSAPPGSDNPNM